MRRDTETKQTLLEGYGDQHLAIALARAKKNSNANARLEIPQIAYRETITRRVKDVEYTHRRQTGGSGQYAKVVISIEPSPEYEFVDEISGTAIDRPFRGSVDKGVQQAMAEGPLAGYKVVNVRVRLTDGKNAPGRLQRHRVPNRWTKTPSKKP